MALSSANDTVYLYEGFFAGINSTSISTNLKNQSLDGLAGLDTVVVEDSYITSHFRITASSAGVVSLSNASGSVSFKNFEQIKFNNFTLKLGTAGNDAITGSSYNDPALFGLGGNDTINGGLGADTMAGGAGNDTYVVDRATDMVTELAGQGTDTIKSSVTYSLVDTDGIGLNGGNVENLVLTGATAINATGNSLNNVLTGNSAANVFSGGAGRDTVSYANATAAVSASLATNNATGFGADTFASIENLVGGKYNDTLTGNGGANSLTGGAGNDVLNGGLGNDALRGGLGSDVFVFKSALGATNVDSLADFAKATGNMDSIQLSKAVFAQAGTAGTQLAADAFNDGSHAVDATDRIIYNPATGALYYDADGSGTAAAAVQFAVVGSTSHPVLSAADFSIIA